MKMLERLLWNEERREFVKFHNQQTVVYPKPIGFPTGFYVCLPGQDGISDEVNIREHAPIGANAYCSGKIHLPNITDRPQSCSFEVQYYQI